MADVSMPMMHLQQALAWLPGAERLGPDDVALQRVHTDTRSLQAGDLFVALKGERFDAHDFLAEAKAQGASAALCHYAAREQLLALDLPALLVPDTKRALGQLAAAWRAQFDLPLIAVTGSNGKTTVTQMLASILRAAYSNRSLATLGNLNNDIGVPLTLLRLRAEHDCAVVELGMNHPGEMAELARLVRPTVALVNNAQREHQEFMATVEAVARENASVWRFTQGPGVAVFPADDDFADLWSEAAQHLQLWRFSADPSDERAVVSAHRAQWADGHWLVQAQTPVGTLRYRLAAPGLHNLRNSLAALTSALAAGVAPDRALLGLEQFQPVKGRSQVHRLQLGTHALTLIDDSYNANPDSVRAAIDMLAAMPGPQLMALGDMGEVGAQGPAFHAEVGRYARQRGIEYFYTLGPLAEHAARAHGAAKHFADRDTLAQAVCSQLPDCSSLLVKGSRFMKMEQVVAAITSSPNVQEHAHAA